MCRRNRYRIDNEIENQLIIKCTEGSEPNTEFLKETAIKMDKSYVLVDKNFETSENNVFAGGDIVRYPLTEEKIVNVGHWQTAQAHGIDPWLTKAVDVTNKCVIPLRQTRGVEYARQTLSTQIRPLFLVNAFRQRTAIRRSDTIINLSKLSNQCLNACHRKQRGLQRYHN